MLNPKASLNAAADFGLESVVVDVVPGGSTTFTERRLGRAL